MPTLSKSGISKPCETTYRQVSNISRTLVGNKTADHSDLVNHKPRREMSEFEDLVPLY